MAHAVTTHNGVMETDTLKLIAQVAEALPDLDAAALERLADALDQLTEAVGLRMEVVRED
ncbi:hypothetical protein SAMN04489810_2221 [Microbacterium pygmaeum]|uniref:Uncharacterized protein n=1 Tax=Microbacterium pygmaeum TaxID=370764 RepID=A0A1G7ZZJ7_9MICO|nr:hypothetical protein SAMN04489810_2221 [Microbacterium pygmaeum]